MVKANAVFLFLSLPFFLRIWVEAVLWRFDTGPQMLGFSFMHGGAGLFTIPIAFSLIATSAYWLFVVVVALLWLIPPARKEMTGTKLVILGGAATLASSVLASLLQLPLSQPTLYLGAALLSALMGASVWLAILSLKQAKRVAV